MEAKTPAPRSQKARGAKKKPILSFSDEEDSDIELFEVDKTSKKKKGKQEIFVYDLLHQYRVHTGLKNT